MTENNPNGSIMDLMDLMINYAGYPILWWITSYVSQIPHVLLLTPLPSGGANSFQHSIFRAQEPRKRCELVLSLLMSRKKTRTLPPLNKQLVSTAMKPANTWMSTQSTQTSSDSKLEMDTNGSAWKGKQTHRDLPSICNRYTLWFLNIAMRNGP